MINFRTVLAILHDLAAVAAAWLIAFWLRFNLELPDLYSEQAWESVLWVVPLYGTFFSPRVCIAASGASRACPICSASP